MGFWGTTEGIPLLTGPWFAGTNDFQITFRIPDFQILVVTAVAQC